MCSRDPRCWTHTDCKRKSDSAGDTGPEEHCGWSYGTLEAALDTENGNDCYVLVLESDKYSN